MAIVVEFTIPADAFPFGQAVSGDPDLHVSLEDIVPFGEGCIPFLWVKRTTEGDFEAFEARLTEHELTDEVETLAQIDDHRLYRITWHEQKEPFLQGIAMVGGAIMDGHVDDTCSFTLRFDTHSDLTQFHQFYQDRGFPVHIDRVYPLGEQPETDDRFGLTPSQHRALVLAVENGYFAVPRETTLAEIGEELGVTRQAASELVRRGAEKALQTMLLEDSVPALDPGSEG